MLFLGKNSHVLVTDCRKCLILRTFCRAHNPMDELFFVNSFKLLIFKPTNKGTIKWKDLE